MIIVAGRRRTGTSLTMQMVAAAGVPVPDGSRSSANPANPRGYFENRRAICDPVGTLRPMVAQHVAVKLFWPHLATLLTAGVIPSKVILTARPAAESAASWAAGFPHAKPVDEEAAATAEAEARRLLLALGVPHLTLKFHDVIDHPWRQAWRLTTFLGARRSWPAVARTPDRALRHHRSPA